MPDAHAQPTPSPKMQAFLAANERRTNSPFGMALAHLTGQVRLWQNGLITDFEMNDTIVGTFMLTGELENV